MKKFSVYFVVCLLVAACGDDTFWNPNGRPSGSTSERINGKTPEDFYAQLYVRRKDGQSLTLSSNSFVNWMQVRTEPDTRAYFRIALHGESKTYTGTYEERKILNIGSPINYEVSYQENLTGFFHIEGTKLVLEDLGELSGITYNGLPAATLEPIGNINLPGLIDHLFVLEQTWVNSL